MRFIKKNIKDIHITDKKVLVRCDFNVPMMDGKILDDRRIQASLPTIRYILDQGGIPILVSHLGRPKGKDDRFTLKSIADCLEQKFVRKISFISDFQNSESKKQISHANRGDIFLLENIRYYSEETKNDDQFAKELADLADIYVNDAFGTSHRAHASNSGVASYIPAVSGFLLEKEINIFSNLLENPSHPVIAILGGSKVSDKVKLIENLLAKVDKLLIGGAACFTFLKAKGLEIGCSLVDDSLLDFARDIMSKHDYQIVLPKDLVITDCIDQPKNIKTVPVDEIPEGWMGVDIGPESIEQFSLYVKHAKTVIWNGPMGIFEKDIFSKGTIGVASSLKECSGETIVGGGDSAAALDKLGLIDACTHVSTGGGAALEMLEGKELPGISILLDKETAVH